MLGSPLPPAIEAIDMVGSLALIFACAYGLTRFAFWARRRLLWRVRRKLILSYVFVGVVPVLLVITFFLLAGLLLFFNVSSYLVKSRLRSLTDQAQFLAQTTVAELQPSPTAGGLPRDARAAARRDRDALPVRVACDRAGGRAAPARWNRPVRPARPGPCR